ncbi:PREDICTED: protein CLAVATA 3-like [Camelina sativa]|uniref:Protein CLAVATA 3-like n=1 Tax=Camelina sativa TaxID=90675 RepID=A0ABM0ZBK6_CAMSA|nr:PREDICTED: protein CLAVATA 3-like [Camelina sativa]
MDSRSLVLLLLFCLLFLHDASDLTQAHADVHALPTRKMMMMKKGSERGGVNGEKEEKLKGLGPNEELRTVPSGPDPLHHHVNPPRQPRNHSHLP